MTQAEIITGAKERLDEDASLSLRYTTAALQEYVTDGVRFYVARTGCQTNTYELTQEANTLLYYLPCDLIQVERVLWQGTDGNEYPLEPTSPRSLDEMYFRWQRQTDTRSRCYFLLGLDRIGLWPLGEADETYVIHYQQDIYDSVSRVPVEDHECLVDYTVARCLLSAGDTSGMEEYGRYKSAVTAAAARRSSVDRTWAQSGGF